MSDFLPFFQKKFRVICTYSFLLKNKARQKKTSVSRELLKRFFVSFFLKGFGVLCIYSFERYKRMPCNRTNFQNLGSNTWHFSEFRIRRPIFFQISDQTSDTFLVKHAIFFRLSNVWIDFFRFLNKTIDKIQNCFPISDQTSFQAYKNVPNFPFSFANFDTIFFPNFEKN